MGQGAAETSEQETGVSATSEKGGMYARGPLPGGRRGLSMTDGAEAGRWRAGFSGPGAAAAGDCCRSTEVSRLSDPACAFRCRSSASESLSAAEGNLCRAGGAAVSPRPTEAVDDGDVALA